MATYTLDWSETNLGGSAVVSYASGAILDFSDKPASATAALSLTANRGDSINVTIAEFSIETSGSSVMTFDYHTSSESGFDKLHIDVDGVSQANFSGTTAWTSHAGINIASAGTHTIRFRYQKDGGGLGGEDRVWVALLNITNTVTTNDDSGTTNTYDMEDGNVPSVCTTSTWTNSTSGPITGSRSLRSPAAPAGSGSYDLDITKPATTGYRPVGFDWKVSSEAGWDKLYIFPDSGAANVPASGHPSSAANPGWLNYSGTLNGRLAVILPAASSTLRLRYAKDGSGDVGSDAAWIDTLRVGASGGSVSGVAAASFGFTATASGTTAVTVTGVAAASFGYTGTAAGIDRALGTAAAPFGFTGTAAGVDRAIGLAAAALGGAFAAAGIRRTSGQATASFGGTFTAEGQTEAPAVTGQATASFGGTFAATGVDRALGVAVATFGFTATAEGSGAAQVTGTASAAFGYTATAQGVDVVLGVAVSSFGFTGAGLGIDRALGGAVTSFGYAATTTGQRRVSAAAVTGLGFTGIAVGVNLSIVTPAERTIVPLPESRVLTVPAEDRTLVVPLENRTLEA